MRTRAGVVLIEDGKVALIERHRAGLDYFVFPGGGVDDGETPEQAAVREAMEELKRRKKDGELSEDDERKLEKDLQTLTDRFIKQLDEVLEKKTAEIMEI